MVARLKQSSQKFKRKSTSGIQGAGLFCEVRFTIFTEIVQPSIMRGKCYLPSIMEKGFWHFAGTHKESFRMTSSDVHKYIILKIAESRMAGKHLVLLSVAGAEPITYKWWDSFVHLQVVRLFLEVPIWVLAIWELNKVRGHSKNSLWHVVRPLVRGKGGVGRGFDDYNQAEEIIESIRSIISFFPNHTFFSLS